MIDVSVAGTSITIIALQTFPIGFSVDELADDTDPLVAEEVETTGYEMLYGGSLFAFDKATGIKVSISVVPGGDDDINMKILLGSRRSSAKILPMDDVTSMIISYPDGLIALSNGTIVSGQLVDSIQNTGRKKGNTYTFVFGTYAGVQSVTQVLSQVASAATSLL
jgi:hypothetical protein